MRFCRREWMIRGRVSIYPRRMILSLRTHRRYAAKPLPWQLAGNILIISVKNIAAILSCVHCSGSPSENKYTWYWYQESNSLSRDCFFFTIVMIDVLRLKFFFRECNFRVIPSREYKYRKINISGCLWNIWNKRLFLFFFFLSYFCVWHVWDKKLCAALFAEKAFFITHRGLTQIVLNNAVVYMYFKLSAYSRKNTFMRRNEVEMYIFRSLTR